jgi:protein-S-isoprenylcysteine O-methyltransferase Ste14
VSTVDPYLVVRGGALYLAAMATAAVCAWRRPPARAITAALLASLWNLPALLALHLAAGHFGWWSFDAQGGVFLGMPVDLYLSWAWLWGALPALAFPSLRLGAVIAIALAADLALMPAAAPVVRLGPDWLTGEFAGLALMLVPAQLLARWTLRAEHLATRAGLQVVAFTGMTLFVLPSAILEATGGSWSSLFSRPAWQLSAIVQVLAVPATIGLTAVQEFVTRGGGTPVPFDPPKRLVTTGVYSYVGNPMQMSATLALLLLGAALGNAWVAASGVMAHVYSVGLASWDEDEDLRGRFGGAWMEYRGEVRRWLPRWRPWYAPDASPARLFVSAQCDMCRQVGEWFGARGLRGLSIVPAEAHPSGALTRITYESADGTQTMAGIGALGRALEHLHFGWAMVGFALRLPMVSPLIQLVVDASGGEPRQQPVSAGTVADISPSRSAPRERPSPRVIH